MASSSGRRADQRGRSDVRNAAARRRTLLTALSAGLLLIFGSCGVVWVVALSLPARKGMLPRFDTKSKVLEDYVEHMEDVSLAVASGSPRTRLDVLHARGSAIEARATTLGVTEEERYANFETYRERMTAALQRNLLTTLTRPGVSEEILWATGSSRLVGP